MATAKKVTTKAAPKAEESEPKQAEPKVEKKAEKKAEAPVETHPTGALASIFNGPTSADLNPAYNDAAV